MPISTNISEFVRIGRDIDEDEHRVRYEVERQAEERRLAEHQWVENIFGQSIAAGQIESQAELHSGRMAQQEAIELNMTPEVVGAIEQEPLGTMCGVCNGPNWYADEMGWFYVTREQANGPQQIFACHHCWNAEQRMGQNPMGHNNGD